MSSSEPEGVGWPAGDARAAVMLSPPAGHGSASTSRPAPPPSSCPPSPPSSPSSSKSKRKMRRFCVSTSEPIPRRGAKARRSAMIDGK
eukprot:scaffold29364_cov96-Isochrysis_galbana.AAC.1